MSAAPIDVRVFFNFRSPYCYLASKSMFQVFDAYRVRLLFRPLAGWHGRSDPERAAKKIPVVRQDVARHARRLGIPFRPPPTTTDPTRAAVLSLLVRNESQLRDYVTAVMHAEWAEGRDIGNPDVILAVAESVGISKRDALQALESPKHRATLDGHWAEGQALGVFGVPSFVIGDEVFWGQDRLDFVREHLEMIGARL
jgi:2-hydroxychromene-2-carboxylate isomerase